MTPPIPRLNFSKPPPGLMGSLGINHDLQWKRYKGAHDPPAMWTGFNSSLDPKRVVTRFGIIWPDVAYIELSRYLDAPASRWRSAARKEAWAYYERRIKLATTLEAHGVRLSMWPDALFWWDNQCDECEAWTGQDAPLEKFPDVLHRLGERSGAPEPQTRALFPDVPPELCEQWRTAEDCRLENKDGVFGISGERGDRTVVLYTDDGYRRVSYWKLRPVGDTAP